ncbi:hypothetical protein D1007_39937 [Hordeum vulgare]|nr:hypothetical protein D1007_39937 [Hordeum vulgare]
MPKKELDEWPSEWFYIEDGPLFEPVQRGLPEYSVAPLKKRFWWRPKSSSQEESSKVNRLSSKVRVLTHSGITIIDVMAVMISRPMKHWIEIVNCPVPQPEDFACDDDPRFHESLELLFIFEDGVFYQESVDEHKVDLIADNPRMVNATRNSTFGNPGAGSSGTPQGTEGEAHAGGHHEQPRDLPPPPPPENLTMAQFLQALREERQASNAAIQQLTQVLVDNRRGMMEDPVTQDQDRGSQHLQDPTFSSNSTSTRCSARIISLSKSSQ